MIFRVSTPQDDPYLITLFNTAFRTPVTLADWDWFARHSPCGLDRTYVLEDEGNIVGSLSFLPAEIWIKGRLHKFSLTHHLVIQQGYRNVKNFINLSHDAFQSERVRGAQLFITTANQRSYRPHKLLTGWADFSYTNYLCKVSPTAQMHTCQEIKSFNTDFEIFYQDIIEKLEFCFHKTSAWMNWRFCNRPRAPYTIYTTREGPGERLSGYVVLKRWQENGYSKAHIIDLHALDDTALLDLVAVAESYAEGCDELNLWAIQGYPYRSLLESRGFAVVESKRQPIIIQTSSPLLFPGGSASYSYGDGDSQY